MKTGWQMEWENEVRYFAPLRAEFNTQAKLWANALEPMRKVVVSFGISMQEAMKSFQQFSKRLEQVGKSIERR